MKLEQRLLLIPIAIYFLLIGWNVFYESSQDIVKRTDNDFPNFIKFTIMDLQQSQWVYWLYGFTVIAVSLSIIYGIVVIQILATLVQFILITFRVAHIVEGKIVRQELSEAYDRLAYNLAILSFLLICINVTKFSNDNTYNNNDNNNNKVLDKEKVKDLDKQIHNNNNSEETKQE